jgi:hypothetical protein
MFFQLQERNCSSIKKKSKRRKPRIMHSYLKKKIKEIKPPNWVEKVEIKQAVQRRKEVVDAAEDQI